MSVARHRLQFQQGLAEAEELHRALVALLASDATRLELDCSEVEVLDTSTVQLLATFVRDARAAEREVALLSPTERLRRVAALFGLTEALALEEVGA